MSLEKIPNDNEKKAYDSKTKVVLEFDSQILDHLKKKDYEKVAHLVNILNNYNSPDFEPKFELIMDVLGKIRKGY